MAFRGNHDDNANAQTPQLRGILKRPARLPTSDGPYTAQHLEEMMEQILSGRDTPSPRPTRKTSARGLQTTAPRETDRCGSQNSAAAPSIKSKVTSRKLAFPADPDPLDLDDDDLLLGNSTSSVRKCSACWKPLGENEGVILRNCQQHIVCDVCLCCEIDDADEVDRIPLCPEEHCCATIGTDEMDAIRERLPTTNSYEQKFTADQKEYKTPMCSQVDDSEEIETYEKLVPREVDNSIVVGVRCDKCEKLVSDTGYLNIRKCKLKHKICFACIRWMVGVSKNLVRCPMYRDCKSMMARDEVLQVKYDIKNEYVPVAKETKSKPKAKLQLIYPKGLPKADLWPVLVDTQCSKCACDVGMLNGIVFKQCNTHAVCVDCVRESMRENRKFVKCPMFSSCRAMMLEEEIEAFGSRFKLGSEE